MVCCGKLRRFAAFSGSLQFFAVMFCGELRRFVAFCSELRRISWFAVNWGVLWRIAANCGVCGELWCVAVNWPSQSRLSDAAVSPGAVSVSDMTPSLHLIQQIEHLTIENGKLAQRLGNLVADKECKNGFLCSVQNDVVS